jgi:Flp pilus assembly protein CpaB
VQNYRGRGQVSIPYLLTIGVAVLLTVVLAARQVSRAGYARVVMAKRALRSGERIDSSLLGFANVAKNAIPAGAVLDPAAILGRTVRRPVTEGKPITATDFAAPSAPAVWLADAPPPGRVVITVSVPGTLLPVQQLRLGDQFEMLAVSKEGKSRIIARDAYLLGSIMGRHQAPKNSVEGLGPSRERPATTSVVGLVLAVRPQDASPIAQSQGIGEKISFVLHGRREIISGHLLEIPTHVAASAPDTAKVPAQVELISGSHREKVNIN